MTQDDKNTGTSGPADTWAQVGERCDALGRSLAAAVRTAWEDEGNRQAVREVESGLQSLASAVAGAVDEAVSSPEGQRMRDEAERAVASAADVGKQAVDEAAPQLISALQALGEGLQSALSHLQDSGPQDTQD